MTTRNEDRSRAAPSGGGGGALVQGDRPRFMLDMDVKAERDLAMEREAVARERDELARERAVLANERAAEKVMLNTQRDIRCYVMTAAELNSLLVADSLVIALMMFQSVTCAAAMVVVLAMPSMGVAAAAVAGLVFVAGSIGGIIAMRWRAHLVSAIRRGDDHAAVR